MVIVIQIWFGFTRFRIVFSVCMYRWYVIRYVFSIIEVYRITALEYRLNNRINEIINNDKYLISIWKYLGLPSNHGDPIIRGRSNDSEAFFSHKEKLPGLFPGKTRDPFLSSCGLIVLASLWVGSCIVLATLGMGSWGFGIIRSGILMFLASLWGESWCFWHHYEWDLEV